MSRKYKFHEKEGAYFISFATVYWIDLFTRITYFDIIIKSINFYNCTSKILALAHAGASILLVPKTINNTIIRKYKFHEKQGAYFVSFATVYWIDLFTRITYFDIIIKSINFYNCTSKMLALAINTS